jgi:hypothetical protein
MSRQSRTELLKTAVVDRPIRAPSNERNREPGPTSEITSCHGFIKIDVKSSVIHSRRGVALALTRCAPSEALERGSAACAASRLCASRETVVATSRGCSIATASQI